ncbi:fibronectin type-III domain-containing protein 3A-like isoform X1 [Tubulanus polymorphus]|uniref:fibronectin type-III domain-containing protein 3A-like isoform X1 n=1 Tax=Tubulanus polymorphus TaxID=672921 RepID=UPI003DA1CA20
MKDIRPKITTTTPSAAATMDAVTTTPAESTPTTTEPDDSPSDLIIPAAVVAETVDKGIVKDDDEPMPGDDDDDPVVEDDNDNVVTLTDSTVVVTQNGHDSSPAESVNDDGGADTPEPDATNPTTTNDNIVFNCDAEAGTGRYSPPAQQPPRIDNNDDDDDVSPPAQQPVDANSAQNEHVVHVHVNPGETFSVRVRDQIQHIQGPATVRMVSNSGPPLPMPMQVPPGHMVQQIVDENGILTHVILSPQPPSIPAPMTVGYYGGPNGTPQQVYPAYGPQYAPYAGQYAPHPHAPAPHMHMAPPHVHTTTPPHQCNNHSHHQHMHPQDFSPSLPHHNNSHHASDERAGQKQKYRPQQKMHQRHRDGYYNAQNASPRRNRGKVNGDIRTCKNEVHSSSSSGDGNEIEEEQKLFRELLSKMQLPKISNIESRSALILLMAPDFGNTDFDVDISDFKYELQLSDKGKEGKYKLVYSGDATEITLQDLKPATEFHLRVCSLLEDMKGDLTESVSFKTQACEPETPSQPKLVSRTKTTLLLKWSACVDNGLKIASYSLEYDQGRGDNSFTEVYNGVQKQFKVTKLSASTPYVFRLSAANAKGKSGNCDAVCYYTSGTAPSQPDPPMSSESFVKALTISWIRRPNDETFTLQMEDEETGHGFIPVYNGPDLSHTIKNLRRNTEYRFRLSANNDEGNSRWSDIVCYRTLPDRPMPPGKPGVKGKIFPTSFRVIWDSPKDNGGTDVTKYILEIDEGRGFEATYEGLDREFVCDRLLPGHNYRLRVSCLSKGGHSDHSEINTITTQARAPDACQAPKLQGKPKATTLHLRWNYPDNDGGSPIQEYDILMTLPDNTTREAYKGRDLDCVVAGLAPGRPYLFQVRAISKAGAGPWSESLEVVSGAGVPDPPRPPTVNCKAPHSAIITWEEPVNNGATVTDYKLEWTQCSESDFTQLYYGSCISYEVKGLTPATTYHFRVQATNSAGPGPFSAISMATTPPSSPGPVAWIRPSVTATTLHLVWKEPNNHGSEIISYNIDIGDRHIAVGNELEYTLEDLVPETTYRIRIQAVNSIGVGAYSSPLKVTMRALPPPPPRLECLNYAPNSLKLKWGENKNTELIQYCVEIKRDNGSYQVIYQGISQNYKVNKLSELMDYRFRISASNEAGQGEYSDDYCFRTTKAPPPAVRAPKAVNVSIDSCHIEWSPCRPMGKDTIEYILQIQHRHDSEYRQLYRGTATSYRLDGLSSKTEYTVRVCAIRICDDDSELTGAYSPGVSFNTQSVQPVRSVATRSADSKYAEPRQLTDQQWAVIILLCFTIFAVLLAFVAQQILAAVTDDKKQ